MSVMLALPYQFSLYYLLRFNTISGETFSLSTDVHAQNIGIQNFCKKALEERNFRYWNREKVKKMSVLGRQKNLLLK